MHAISHSLSHRGSSASRTRTRWQPYSSIPSSSSRSPSSACLNTPATTVSTPASAQQISLCEPEHLKHCFSSSNISLSQRDGIFRDVQKLRYVNGLVDLAVKSLCEIWHPHDIPHVFSTPTRIIVPAPCTNNSAPTTSTHQHNTHAFYPRYTQLPSPVSPGNPSPSLPPTPLYTTTLHPLHTSDISSASGKVVRSNIVPLKGFVHEVLRRSRTSCSVLQTALCYLEAIRSKVPGIIQQEKLGTGIRGEPDQSTRIIQADESEADLCSEVNADDLMGTSYSADSDSSCGSVEPTVRITDTNIPPSPSFLSASQHGAPYDAPPPTRRPREPSAVLPPLPPLPSPLLCPRRSFLAALILASKFTQDKCYSNRAWAKLAGLPAREIGRCERALGEALEWRLWVGKLPPSRGPVTRSRSDGELFPQASTSSMEASTSGSTPNRSMPPPSTFRRSNTLPADAFASTLSQDIFVSPPSLLASSTLMSMASTSRNLPSTSQFGPLSTPVPVPPMTLCSHGEAGTNYSSSAFYPPPASEASATPSLIVSPSSTISSQDSLCEERTIQMISFVDVASPLPMKVDPTLPVPPPAYAYAYAGDWPSTVGRFTNEDGIRGPWSGVSWSAGGVGFVERGADIHN
ncbi:hypothetical protein EW146_g184 [Bondarzewia mesenterica]|uniref:Cyclin N-terminal domain-containing protein n=1 Tax=Bondarzewia mesenterica TaxID=1095465 RepID=A0A4S4M7Z5_9AGAM|nr:hypothetical protein EW146_g184 [Bondarzewia mesenterica]